MFKAEGYVESAVDIQANKFAGSFHVPEGSIGEIERKGGAAPFNYGEETFIEKLAQDAGYPSIGSKRGIRGFEDYVIVSPTNQCIGLQFVSRSDWNDCAINCV